MKSGSLISKTHWVILHQGPVELLRRTWCYIRKHRLKELWIYQNRESTYKFWLKKESRKVEKDLKAAPQVIANLCYRPLISIVMSVSNIQSGYLEKSITSVLNQEYPFWELCIAYSVSSGPRVLDTLDKYRGKDSRLKIISSDESGIIKANNMALKLAKGEYVGFLDCDDVLAPHAILEVVKLLNGQQDIDMVYSDEDRLTDNGARKAPFFKPDWSPDLLLSMNYIGNFMVVRRLLVQRLCGFREGVDGSEVHDFVLRLSEETKKIAHISQILYHKRLLHGLETCVPENYDKAFDSGLKVIEEALKRRGVEGDVLQIGSERYHVKYRVQGEPLVSIIIPTKDKVHLLKRCINSIREKSYYCKYEIFIIDNDSVETETKAYFEDLKRIKDCRVLHYNDHFNYSKINNWASRQAKGDYLLFLNNDTEVITADWLEELLSHCQRPEIGAVGAKLLFPDGNIQHAGVVVGLFGVAGHAFYGRPCGELGYMGFASVTRNYSAVTAACLMMRRDVFNEAGGFDESLDIAYNDVDLCLKVVNKGYFIVWTPQAVLYHHECATRGLDLQKNNIRYFCDKWNDFLKNGDPFYNSNLSLNYHDFRINL